MSETCILSNTWCKHELWCRRPQLLAVILALMQFSRPLRLRPRQRKAMGKFIVRLSIGFRVPRKWSHYHSSSTSKWSLQHLTHGNLRQFGFLSTNNCVYFLATGNMSVSHISRHRVIEPQLHPQRMWIFLFL